MRRIALLALVVALLVLPAAASALPRGAVLIDTGDRTVRVRVEIADEPSEWATGLMNRPSLARDSGMLFLFPTERRRRFWMKNTTIPLSIAFAGQKGRVLRILDMAPCPADPCRLYDPGVAFKTALEVNRGAFRRWDVRPGDRLRLVR
jgi:hypothetical protein